MLDTDPPPPTVRLERGRSSSQLPLLRDRSHNRNPSAVGIARSLSDRIRLTRGNQTAEPDLEQGPSPLDAEPTVSVVPPIREQREDSNPRFKPNQLWPWNGDAASAWSFHRPSQTSSTIPQYPEDEIDPMTPPDTSRHGSSATVPLYNNSLRTSKGSLDVTKALDDGRPRMPSIMVQGVGEAEPVLLDSATDTAAPAPSIEGSVASPAANAHETHRRSSWMPRLPSLWPSSTSEDTTNKAGATASKSDAHGDQEPSLSRSSSLWRRYQDSHKAQETGQEPLQLHSNEMVDYLDVLDPAVGIFNTLQDYGNSSMIPNVPWLYNRRPKLRIDQFVRESEKTLESPPMSADAVPVDQTGRMKSISKIPSIHLTEVGDTTRPLAGKDDHLFLPNKQAEESQLDLSLYPAQDQAAPTEEQSTDSHDTLKKAGEEEEDPHTDRWYAMDEEERRELEGHIKYLLNTKSKTKRMFKGFWNFVRTPMGFILTTYIFLIFSWGVAIFLFIVNWVHVEPYHKWRLWVEVCDQVLCALFVTRGVGFAPYRVVDTYRMVHIAHFHFLTYRRRKLLNLPKLANESELPRYTEEQLAHIMHDNSKQISHSEHEVEDISQMLERIGVKNANELSDQLPDFNRLLTPIPGHPAEGKVILSREEQQKERLRRAPSIQSIVEKQSREVSVLTPKEQALLQHYQRRFHASHTFYRYCETETHRPFPLWLMMTIVSLLDVYSMLQCCLAGTMWGIRYERRPTSLTASIVSSSLSCNIIAGLLIWQGGKRTRKTEVVERRVKLALEERAIERMERKRLKNAQVRQEQILHEKEPTQVRHRSW